MPGRIRITYDAITHGLEAGSQRAERSIDGVGDAAHRTNAKLAGTSVSIDRATESTDRYSRSSRTASKDTDSLSKHIQGVNARFTGMRNVVSLIKWPALIAGAGYAAQGLGSLSAGAIALTSALAPLAGALVAYPALLGSFAQGLGVAALAVGGVKGVLSEMNKEQLGAGESAKQSGKAQEAAAEGVRSAERQLTQAQVGAKRAQTELTLARKEAVENLKDLKNAAIDAGFGEKRAALGLRDAKVELSKALAEPGQHTNSELESLELGVKEARQGLKESRLEQKRADREAAKGSREGVTGSPKFREAKRQLNEANLQAAEASRGLVNAEKAQQEAMEETSTVAGKLASKMAALPAATQKFAKYLFSLKPQLKDLQGAAANGLFPGVESGIHSALNLFPRLKTAVGETGKVMGGVARRAGELVGSKGFGRDFTKIASGNATILGRMGNSGLKLADALRHVLVAAQPLLMWMAKSTEAFATWIDNSARAGRETGKLGGFFDKTRRTMETVGSILKNVAVGFLEIGKAAFPLGNSILKSLNGQAENFAHWTQSLEGKNALRDYFQQAKPGIFELGRLVKDVAGAFLSLSNSTGFYTLTHEVRTKLVPVFKELLEGTTKSLGPALVEGLVQLGRLFGSLAGSNGPLVLFVGAVTNLLKAANALITTVPGMKTLVLTLGGIAAVSKAMKFVGMVTGLSTALGIAKKIAATLGIIDAEQIAAGGGVAPVATGVKTAAEKTAVKDAGQFGEKALLRDAGLFAGGSAGSGLVSGAGVRAVASKFAPLAAAAGAYFAVEFGAKAIKGLTGKDFLENQNLAKSLIHGFNTENVASTEERALAKASHREGIRAGINSQQIGVFQKTFRNAMTDLSVAAIGGMDAVNKDLGRGLATASALWITGTTPWRTHAAKAMEGAVSTIERGMQLGTISADRGQKEINKLLAKIHLVKGDDPFGLAQASTKSFKEANGITATGVKAWIAKLAQLPRAARESTVNSTTEMLKAWAQGHPKIEKQIEALTSFETRKFGATNKQIREGVKQDATGPIADAFREAAAGVGGALQNIGTNTNRMLKALGLKDIVEFQALVLGPSQRPSLRGEAAANAHHHTAPGAPGARGHEKAVGGSIARVPGQGLKDTVPLRVNGEMSAIVAPGEDLAAINRHQRPLLDYAVSSAFPGVHGLWDFFDKFNRPHYLAGGGEVKVKGPGMLGKIGHSALSRVVEAANSFVNRHRPKTSPTGGAGSPRAFKHGKFTFPLPAGSWGQPISVDQGVDIAAPGHTPLLAIAPGTIKGHGISGFGPWTPILGIGGGTEVYYGHAGPGNELKVGTHVRAGQVIGEVGEGIVGMSTGPHLEIGFYPPGPMGAGAAMKTALGLARGGRIGSLAKGSTFENINHKYAPHWAPDYGGQTLPFFEVAALAESVGMPGVTMAQMAKGESGLRPGSAGVDPGGTKGYGLWAITSPFNDATVAKYGGYNEMWNPVKNAKVAAEIYHSQGLGAWYGNKYVTSSDAHYKGKFNIAAVTGRGAQSGGGSKPKVPRFPAGHTGTGGGTYGSKAGPVTKPPKMHESALPGLPAGSVEAAVPGLPPSVQNMLSQPGLTFAQKLSIGELAGTIASGTKQPTFDAAGNETSADSHADDIAAAEYQKKLVRAAKLKIEKRLREIAKRLKEPHTKKAERALLHEQAELLSKLGADVTALQGLNATIHQGPEPSEGGSESEAGTKAQEELVVQLEQMNALLKEQRENTQRALNVSQSQYAVLAQAITAVVSGQIGGQAGLGFQTPSVAGSLAAY